MLSPASVQFDEAAPASSHATVASACAVKTCPSVPIVKMLITPAEAPRMRSPVVTAEASNSSPPASCFKSPVEDVKATKAFRRDPKKTRSCNGGRVCGRTRCVTEKRVSGDLSKVREGEVARNVSGQGDGGAGRRAQSRERARELVGTGGACIFCEEPARISQEERRGKGGNRQSTNRR